MACSVQSYAYLCIYRIRDIGLHGYVECIVTGTQKHEYTCSGTNMNRWMIYTCAGPYLCLRWHMWRVCCVRCPILGQGIFRATHSVPLPGSAPRDSAGHCGSAQGRGTSSQKLSNSIVRRRHDATLTYAEWVGHEASQGWDFGSVEAWRMTTRIKFQDEPLRKRGASLHGHDLKKNMEGQWPPG